MNLDILIFQQINGLAGKSVCWDALGIFFAKYFEYVLVALVFLLLWKNLRGIFWAFFAAILARFGIVELIRFCWFRSRPFVENNANLLVEATDKSSFPSGHATFYFALSFVVYQYNKKAGVFFFCASCLISLARVFVGLHWPSDIIGGAIVGLFTGWLLMKVSRRF